MRAPWTWKVTRFPQEVPPIIAGRQPDAARGMSGIAISDHPALLVQPDHPRQQHHVAHLAIGLLVVANGLANDGDGSLPLRCHPLEEHGVEAIHRGRYETARRDNPEGRVLLSKPLPLGPKVCRFIRRDRPFCPKATS